jgi:TonB family protein
MRAQEFVNEDLTRRGFLRGMGAAAVAGAGAAPEKAQSNILIPILQGLLGADIPRPDVACAPRGIALGQKVSWRGETQEVIQIYGEHRYCKNPDFPIAVKVGKLAPGKEPIDTDLEQKRKENMARMANSGSSNTYLQRIAARIKPNITFSDAQLETVVGNPVAEVEVQCAPDGSIVARKLIKSSGYAEWDQAVIKAIDRTQQLPRDIDGNVPTRLNINFRPKDTPTNESVDQGVAEGAVEDLEKDLDNPKSYSAIDHMMQTIARDHGITGRQLHDKFVDKHGVIPDKWTRDQLRELSFLGSECTKDCSGHRAGYDWSKRKGLRQANSLYSPSFNKGAALAVAGK